ncbi:glycosyltransferase family 2 protein [Luminiphilus sp.]|nr:glycosyltransferase family 2 protein [Luminiphilus sp.]
MARLLIVIPALDEALTLPAVIADIKNKYPPAEILVIDDSSSDGTRNVAIAAGAGVLSLASQLGPWPAAQCGIRYGVERGFDLTITMDADGQHPPEFIPKIIERYYESKPNIVIGGGVERGSLVHYFAWHLIRIVSGLRVTDLTSGFRLYDRQACELLASREASFLEHQDVGILSMAVRAGLTIEEIEIIMEPRRHGESRIFGSWLKIFFYMLNTLLLALSKRPLLFEDEKS